MKNFSEAPLTSLPFRLIGLPAIVLAAWFGLIGTSQAVETEFSGDPSAVVQKEITASPAEVKSSWTAEDFRNAIPLDSPTPEAEPFNLPSFPDASTSAKRGDYVVQDPTSLPKRLHGKVFFKIGSLLYTCSGTVISSRYGNAIFTAGHCVFDRESRTFVTDLVFAPAYQQGTFPLGLYAATSLATTKGWQNGKGFSNDIGIVTLNGTPVASLGGARPVAFNQNVKKRKYTILGYPADPNPPFDGERMFGCRSKVVGRDRGRPKPMAVYPCYMSHGASGGGWISGGYLSSVTSYVYCDTAPKYCGYLFAPYFAKSARNLYESPAVGGSVDPVITFTHRPARKTKKRKVRIGVNGLASTPLKFQCRLDRRKFKKCSKHATFRHLSRGRHTIRVRGYDQTGRLSANVIRTKFKVRR